MELTVLASPVVLRVVFEGIVRETINKFWVLVVIILKKR